MRIINVTVNGVSRSFKVRSDEPIVYFDLSVKFSSEGEVMTFDVFEEKEEK